MLTANVSTVVWESIVQKTNAANRARAFALTIVVSAKDALWERYASTIYASMTFVPRAPAPNIKYVPMASVSTHASISIVRRGNLAYAENAYPTFAPIQIAQITIIARS